MSWDEKRKKRSSIRKEALALQLAACAEDSNLEAIVLSDADGLCLASCGDLDTCEEIAANLPFVGDRSQGHFEGVLFSAAKAWKVTVHRFEVLGSELYLCAAGGKGDARDKELNRSLGGVERILAAA
jgi:hypothetical protein